MIEKQEVKGNGYNALRLHVANNREWSRNLQLFLEEENNPLSVYLCRKAPRGPYLVKVDNQDYVIKHGNIFDASGKRVRGFSRTFDGHNWSLLDPVTFAHKNDDQLFCGYAISLGQVLSYFRDNPEKASVDTYWSVRRGSHSDKGIIFQCFDEVVTGRGNITKGLDLMRDWKIFSSRLNRLGLYEALQEYSPSTEQEAGAKLEELVKHDAVVEVRDCFSQPFEQQGLWFHDMPKSQPDFSPEFPLATFNRILVNARHITDLHDKLDRLKLHIRPSFTRSRVAELIEGDDLYVYVGEIVGRLDEAIYNPNSGLFLMNRFEVNLMDGLELV